MTFAVNQMWSTHKLVTILVAIVVIAVNIAILHVLFALVVKHHNNNTTCYKSNAEHPQVGDNFGRYCSDRSEHCHFACFICTFGQAPQQLYNML